MTSNSKLFGTSLEGTALDAALTAEPQGYGVAVLDGSVSLLNMMKIKKSPFVDDVIIYFPILDKDCVPMS